MELYCGRFRLFEDRRGIGVVVVTCVRRVRGVVCTARGGGVVCTVRVCGVVCSVAGKVGSSLPTIPS